MTERIGRFDEIWRGQDDRVAAGLFPGYVAAVRIGGTVEVRAGGRMAIEPDSAPMTEHTRFRIASVTKLLAGALTLGLVRDGVLALADPISRWLPEAAHPRVLLRPDGPLDETTEAQRAITVRDLLTCTSGWGCVMAPTPLQAAMFERGVFPSALPQQPSDEEFVQRVTALPLAFQPGDGWLYDTGIDLLGILLARATGTPLPDLFAERITEPLGMTSTSFWATDPGELPPAYMPSEHGLEVMDPPDGAFYGPRGFAKLSGGVLSTAPDLLRFLTAMADGGGPILDADAVAQLTTPAITEEQRRQGYPILDQDGMSWGLGTSVDLSAAKPWMAPGRWGWTGGTGTTAYVDPSRDTVSVLLTQRLMSGPQDGFDDFWTAVAKAA